MFFPGLHLGPRACSPQANQQMNRGQEAGLRSDCHIVRGEGGTGVHLCERNQVCPAVFLSCFAE